MKVGRNYVRLDDGTCWAFDRTSDDANSLEWIQRYGTTEEVYRQRLTVAEVLGSYGALVMRAPKRRSEIVTAIRAALATEQPSEGEPK